MKGRPRYKLPNSRRTPGSPIYWLLVVVLVLMVALGWFWWHSAKKTKQPAVRQSLAVNSATRTQINPPPLRVPQAVAPPAPVTDSPIAPPGVNPATNTAASAVPAGQYPRHVQNVLEAQLALIQLGISSGSLDGAIGSQTRAALPA